VYFIIHSSKDGSYGAIRLLSAILHPSSWGAGNIPAASAVALNLTLRNIKLEQTIEKVYGLDSSRSSILRKAVLEM
jgi:hypothetical protein